MTPSGPVATASLTAPPGRQAKTMPAASATAFGEAQAMAPRATKGAIASGRGSKTCRVTSSASSRSAIGAPIWPSPMKPIRVVLVIARAPLAASGRHDAAVDRQDVAGDDPAVVG